MTILLGGLALVVSIACGIGISSVGAAASLDARVQLAADAAALAAVAEWGPGGSGRPDEMARKYAELNGARLIRCTCAPGGHAVQVTVAIGDASARARAEMDASLFRPDLESARSDLHPLLAASVSRLLSAGRGSIHVVSGYRSGDEQARLWTGAIARYGDPEIADDWVARPGTSMHELGLAVDLGGDLDLAASLVDRLGLPLVRPLPHEPHHFELSSLESPSP